MSLLSHSPISSTSWKWKDVRLSPSSFSGRWKGISKSNCSQFGFTGAHSHKSGVRALLFNPFEDPILKEAVKEPVAFMGGIFAGILRLDLEEEPLKEWVTRTVEAAGISEDEVDTERSKTEAAPQQIEIE
ncbi:UPF0426 protein At1g28150, chloroplastic [Prosopis cineraria]|uniref:UPF0426 protein At1g28150, chloroplastic n=1 Tax=Prosopis cineraria TaxID=364024 RepID=UPI00240F36A9|nr:UPF0426 protein At1g28150, chloroplastic [Prosopis cineraria]